MNEYLTYTQSSELVGFINENAYGCSMNTMNESAQIGLSNAVLDKMFALTIGKYNKIDFAEIERSRGDVTRCRFYKNLTESISILTDIAAASNKLSGITIVSEALQNMLDLKPAFEKSFRLKNNCSIFVYNSIYYAIMEATSYYIAASINMVKSGDSDVKINIYDVNNKDCILISSLNKFNSCVNDGSIKNFIANTDEVTVDEKEDKGIAPITEAAVTKNDIMKTILSKTKSVVWNSSEKHLTSVGVAAVSIGAVAGIIFIASKIIPFIREIIYWIYKARHKISESAQLQADFLAFNINTANRSNPDAEIVIEKQQAAMDKFRKIADKFSLDSDKANRDSQLDIKNDRVDVSDVVI